MIGLGGEGDGQDWPGGTSYCDSSYSNNSKVPESLSWAYLFESSLKGQRGRGMRRGAPQQIHLNITSVWPLLVPYRGLYIAGILLSLLHISLQAETWLPFLPTPGCYINRTTMSCWGPLGRPPRQVPQLPYDCDPAVEGRFGCHANFLNGSYGYFGGESGYPESNSYRNSPGSLVRNCQEECWFFIST